MANGRAKGPPLFVVWSWGHLLLQDSWLATVATAVATPQSKAAHSDWSISSRCACVPQKRPSVRPVVASLALHRNEVRGKVSCPTFDGGVVLQVLRRRASRQRRGIHWLVRVSSWFWLPGPVRVLGPWSLFSGPGGRAGPRRLVWSGSIETIRPFTPWLDPGLGLGGDL